MMREQMFKILKAAGFWRTKTCCEGVELKVCNTDEWRGNMDSLFYHIEKDSGITVALREVVDEYVKYFKVTNNVDLLELTEEAVVEQMSTHTLKIWKAAQVLKEFDARVTG